MLELGDEKMIYVLGIILLIFVLWICYMAKKYANPYKLIMIVAKKGGGKTTDIAKRVQLDNAKGWTCFSTVEIPGAYLINGEDIGKFYMPPKSSIFIDEVGMLYDNRDWKTGALTKEVRNYFKLQRHYKHKVRMYSQAWDVDVKLRNLTDQIYLLQNWFGFMSVGYQVKRKIVVVKPSADAESRIADELIVSPFIMTPFGGRTFTYIPHWIKLFNSYDAPELPEKEFKMVGFPDDVEITKRGRVRVKKSQG